MKKLISLILVLVLSLTAVSAFAAYSTNTIFSPNTLQKFGISGDEAQSLIDFLELILPVPQESKDTVNNLVKGGNLLEDLYKKTIFVGQDGEPTDQKELEGKDLTNIILIPFPGVIVHDDLVGTAEYGEIITPIPAAIAEYLLANLDKVVAFFSYKVTQEDVEQFYTHQVNFEIRKTGDYSYGIVYKIPVNVLRKAQGWPIFVSFELVSEKAAQ